MASFLLLTFLASTSVMASGYCIIGTLVSTKKENSFAVLAYPEEDGFSSDLFDDYRPRNLTFARIGDSFFQREICGITSRYVCLSERLGRESMMLVGECLEGADFLEVPKELEKTDQQVLVTHAYRDSFTSGVGLAKAMMQAGVEPYEEQGRQVGYRIEQIDPDSIYADVGLQNGDIIKSINGMQLVGASEAVRILLGLKTEDSYTIELIRNSMPISIKIGVK